MLVVHVWCWRVKKVHPLPHGLGRDPHTALLWASAPWIIFFCRSVMTASADDAAGEKEKQHKWQFTPTVSAVLSATPVSGELRWFFFFYNFDANSDKSKVCSLKTALNNIFIILITRLWCFLCLSDAFLASLSSFLFLFLNFCLMRLSTASVKKR